MTQLFRRTQRALAAAIASAVLVAACSTGDGRDAENGTAAAGALLSDVVTVDGSNGVMPLVQALADAYMASTPDAHVAMGGGLGSRERLDSLRTGFMDIAMASHGLDTIALAAEGLDVYRFAETPVLLGVHAASVAVQSLTRAQLCSVLSGTITTWRALGDSSSLPITVVVRPSNEVDMEVLQEAVACDKPISSGAVQVEETSDMARMLAETPGAIGVTTATVALQSDGAIRALALDAVAPTVAEVRSGTYQLLRSSFLITRGESTGPAVRAFLDFVRSAAGQAVMEANGSVGVPE